MEKFYLNWCCNVTASLKFCCTCFYCLGQCPVTGFGISCVEPSSYFTTEVALGSYFVSRRFILIPCLQLQYYFCTITQSLTEGVGGILLVERLIALAT
jgi:hypothetical protein